MERPFSDARIKGGGPRDLHLALCTIPEHEDETESLLRLLSYTTCTQLECVEGWQHEHEPLCQALRQNKTIRYLEWNSSDNDVTFAVIKALMHHPRVSHVDISPDHDSEEPCIAVLRSLLETNRNVVSAKLHGEPIEEFKALEFQNRVHQMKQIEMPSVWPHMLRFVQPSLMYLFINDM